MTIYPDAGPLFELPKEAGRKVEAGDAVVLNEAGQIEPNRLTRTVKTTRQDVEDDALGYIKTPFPYQTGDSPGARSARAAWQSVSASGWACASLKVVVEVLADYGNLTALEVDERAGQRIASRHPSAPARSRKGQSTYIRRLFELQHLGIVEAGELRPCKVLGFGKKAVAYRLTGKPLPEARP